jgi:acyl dehydratase
MGLDLNDTSEMVTLSVPHPSHAPELLGKSFTSCWFTMDPDRSDEFDRATYLDHQQHPYVGQEGYGAGLVEGFHLLGLLDCLCNSALWSEGPWIAWNYGLDHARFVSIVRRDDRLRLKGTVAEVTDRGAQGHLLLLDLVGDIEGREKPGFVARLRVLWATHAGVDGPGADSPAS